MNAPQDEVQKRKSESDRIRLIFEDFRRSEQPLIDQATVEFESVLTEAMPRLHGYALESGSMIQRATVEVVVDLSTGKKSVTINCITTPPPCSISRSRDISY